MLAYIIPIVIIIVSVGALAWIVIKKFPQLSEIAIDVEAAEKESAAKRELLKKRLFRRLDEMRQKIRPFINPVVSSIKQFFKDFHDKILSLEQEYKKLEHGSPEHKQNVVALLKQAKVAYDKSDWADVERKALAIIKLDKENISAYQMLAEMYLEQKKYAQVEETLQFVVKLLKASGQGDKNIQIANVFAEIGELQQEQDRHGEALHNYQKALEYEENNPRYLDLAFDICIILKNKKLASQYLAALEATDPGNQQLDKLRQQLQAIKK